MEAWKDAFSAMGRGVARAGVWVGGKVADGYRAIDPDVMRHVAQTPLLAPSLFVPRRGTIEPGVPDGQAPLVFVHGLGGSRGDFLPMSLYLRLHGHRRSYSAHFDEKDTIPAMAAGLARFVRAVLEATDEDAVEIVAHSLGGLVVRLALVEHDLAPVVRTVVTLGSPHRGTHPARFANTPKTRDLRPDSPLVQRLNDAPWPEQVRGVTCWSRNDLFVLPAESATLEGTEQVELTPFTHYSYLIDPRSWAAVARALEG